MANSNILIGNQVPRVEMLPWKAKANIELWQFLLELLITPGYGDKIRWTRRIEGEFEFLQPNEVAKMWGFRKGKSEMTYDKMSRALRYYYGKRRIEKQRGKLFRYRFDCDLMDLTGHSGLAWAGKSKRSFKVPSSEASNVFNRKL